MKVLIFGLGSIAQKHIVAIQSNDPDAEIFALRRQSSKDNFVKGVRNITAIEEIDCSEIDFFLITNPTSEHYKTIQIIMEYEKPLFIEKPLFSTTNAETEQLVTFIKNRNIKSYIACNLRFLDALIKLKQLIKGKRVNEVNSYCGSYLPAWRPNVDFRMAYSANKEMGGGVHIDLIHELDYIYWIFGSPIETKSFFSNRSSLNISAYDYANYLWQYDQYAVSIILNYYRNDSKRTLEVLTEEGTYIVDLLKNTIEYNGQLVFESKQRMSDTYSTQMQYFITHAVKGKNNMNSIDEANKILKLCMQA